MIHPTRLFRSLPLVLAIPIAQSFAPAHAQTGCQSTISADVSVVSVTAGGVQNLSLTVPPAQAGKLWHLVGTLSGTSPGLPYFATGGLFLNQDRYTYAMVTGTSPLVQGGTPNAYGVIPTFDAQGHAHMQVVIPPVIHTALIGRTAHHGFYRLGVVLLPECGSNTVALTFAP